MRLSPFMLITAFLAVFCSPVISAYRIISFVDVCPVSGCTVLEDNSGEIHLEFSEKIFFRECILVFATQFHNLVFLSLVSDPLDCHWFQLHVYDGRTHAANAELSRGGICTDTNSSETPHAGFRSFITSDQMFSIVLEDLRVSEVRKSPVAFTLYYKAFQEEEILIEDICHMCQGNETNAQLGRGVCESLLPNCTGIAGVIRASCPESDGDRRSEAVGIFMAGAVIFTIIFVALNCGGAPAVKVRTGVVPIEAGAGRNASNVFSSGGRAGVGGAVRGGKAVPIAHV